MSYVVSIHGRPALLFIEPCQPPSSEPVIDSLTRKMTAAWRKAETSDYVYFGVHQCVCSVLSTNCNYYLRNGAITNSLCVHYLAYHREEVPPEELEKVSSLEDGQCEPHPSELQGEEYRKASLPRGGGEMIERRPGVE